MFELRHAVHAGKSTLLKALAGRLQHMKVEPNNHAEAQQIAQVAMSRPHLKQAVELLDSIARKHTIIHKCRPEQA